MALYTIIRDWFVQYIWGGVLSSGNTVVSSRVGRLANINNGTVSLFNETTGDFMFPINAYAGHSTVGGDIYISISDWLSTTSTIIVLILLCVVFGLMVRWLFRLTSGLLQGR